MKKYKVTIDHNLGTIEYDYTLEYNDDVSFEEAFSILSKSIIEQLDQEFYCVTDYERGSMNAVPTSSIELVSVIEVSS